jgi:hypothetical protein
MYVPSGFSDEGMESINEFRLTKASYVVFESSIKKRIVSGRCDEEVRRKAKEAHFSAQCLVTFHRWRHIVTRGTPVEASNT